MSRENIQQFHRRAAEERALGASAADPRAAKRHQDLAEKYDAVAAAYREVSIAF
jgi:hypothetical protein